MMVAGATEQLRVAGHLRDSYAPPLAAYGMPGVQYPPLFILLNTIVTVLSGLNPILAERLLAWALYLGSAGLVGALVWQETREKWAALVATALPFCFWNVIIFLHAGRVDPLALFLSLSAAWLYRHHTKNSFSTPRLLLLVAALCVLAFLSKQTYLAISAAIFFDLIIKAFQQRKTSQSSNKTALRPSIYNLPTGQPYGPQSTIYNPLIFSLAWLVWAALGLGLLGLWSDGQLFGIYDPTRAGSFIFERVPGFISIFLLDHLPLLAIALPTLWLLARRGLTFWPLYTLFAALSCVSLIKDGAVDYYFNELSYGLAVVIGIGLAMALKPTRVSTEPVGATVSARKGLATAAHYPVADQSRRDGRSYRRFVTVGLTVQGLIALGMLIGWSHWRDFDISRGAYDEGLALVRSAQASEAQGGKPALVLVDSFLLATGRGQEVGDYFIYSVLLTNGQRDPAPLLHDLESGRYSFLITENFLRWPPSVETVLASRYNLRKIEGTDGRKPYWVYTPK